MAIDNEDVVTDPLEFVAEIVNVDDPRVVGVPDSTPVPLSSVRPAGSDPEARAYAI